MMKSFITSLLISQAVAYPWLSPSFDGDFSRGIDLIKRDPATLQALREIYADQKREVADWMRDHPENEARDNVFSASTFDKRTSSSSSSSCLQHPLPDFMPTNITGLRKFPEKDHPYQDPKPSDQRGPCPGLNTLANHGYIARSGIAGVAETIKASYYVFGMGVDIATFLAAGSAIIAGDIPSMKFSLGGADKRTNSAGALGVALGTETGLSGHLRFKETDASATRCDFYLCDGDNHNLNATIFGELTAFAKANGGQYNIPAITQHFASQFNRSLHNNPYFYFIPQQAALVIGATYFIPGFFSNGTIGFGGVANEASIASFVGARFNSDGSISYQPEQIPPQGWYRRGFPLMFPEAIAAISTLYFGAATILKMPDLFGANTGTPNSFNAVGSLSSIQQGGGTPTVRGVTCAIEGGTYGSAINEFGTGINLIFGTFNSVLEPIFGPLGCPIPSGAPAYQGTAPTFPGYPKPSPCTINRHQNGVDQCAPDTNTYDIFNTKKVPFCLNSPKPSPIGSNPIAPSIPF